VMTFSCFSVENDMRKQTELCGPLNLFPLQGIATTLWAISRMGIPTRDAHDLIDSLAHRAVVSIPSVPPSLLAHILWSLARLRHADPRCRAMP
jgi:hypothetical protein